MLLQVRPQSISLDRSVLTKAQDQRLCFRLLPSRDQLRQRFAPSRLLLQLDRYRWLRYVAHVAHDPRRPILVAVLAFLFQRELGSKSIVRGVKEGGQTQKRRRRERRTPPQI